MEKTQTKETVQKQYVVDRETAAKFLFKVDAEQTAVETQTTNQGNFLYHVKEFTGTITIQKSGRVVAKLHHYNIAGTDGEIQFTKRFSSEKKLMELAEELKDAVEDIRAKARKAKIASSKKTKKEQPKAETQVAPEQKKHGKNALGHIFGTIADQLDNLFLSNATYDDMVAAGYKPARIKGHFKHLLKDKANLVDIKFENGQYFAKLIN